MRPPICEICNKDFNPDREGGLLYFKKTPEGLEFDRRVEEEGIVGHPPYAGWFCGKHYPRAMKLTDMSLREALRKIT